MEPKIGFAWLTFSAGLLLLGYGLWSLYLGKAISAWAMVYRPSAIYWVTVGAFILLGGANVIHSVWRLSR